MELCVAGSYCSQPASNGPLQTLSLSLSFLSPGLRARPRGSSPCVGGAHSLSLSLSRSLSLSLSLYRAWGRWQRPGHPHRAHTHTRGPWRGLRLLLSLSLSLSPSVSVTFDTLNLWRWLGSDMSRSSNTPIPFLQALCWFSILASRL